MTDIAVDKADPPAVAPVHPQTAEEVVTDALRKAILRGDLPPGRRLGQKELAEQLGVSRIPLRDALRRLEEEALVRIDGRRGAWVTTLDTRDIAEIYELRILLEERAVCHVVNNLTDQDADDLLELAQAMDEAETDPIEGRLARREFYDSLYRLAERPRMAKMILQLRDNVGRYHILSDSGHSHEAHAALLRSLKVRDVDTASTVLREHLEEARDDLIESMIEDEKAAAAE